MRPKWSKRRETSVTNPDMMSTKFLAMGYEGKIVFWTEQLALAQNGEGRYSLERATDSLAHFKSRQAATAFTIESNPLEGVELLRDAAYWSGTRHEYLNDNKSPMQIIEEYKQYLAES
jgi:hypothetical protein